MKIEDFWVPGEPTETNAQYVTVRFNDGEQEAVIPAYNRMGKWFVVATSTTLKDIFGEFDIIAHMGVPMPYNKESPQSEDSINEDESGDH